MWPSGGQPGRHRQGPVPAEGADLEHATRLGRPHERLEEAAGNRPGQHLRAAELLGGHLRELGEIRLVRGGDALGVVLESFVDVHPLHPRRVPRLSGRDPVRFRIVTKGHVVVRAPRL